MKWFEHKTNERNELASKLIKRKFGMAGYGIFESLKEIIGENMENDNVEEWGFVSKNHDMTSLASEIGCSEAEFRAFVSFCDDQLILEKKDGRLFCSLMLERMNEYAKRVFRNSGKKNVTEKPDNPEIPETTETTASQHNTNTTQHNTGILINAEPGSEPVLVPSDDGMVEDLLREDTRKPGITQKFQFLGLQIFEMTNAPPEKKSECMRIAKIYPEGRVMAALSFSRDYPQPNLKWKMFLWKLAELGKKDKK